MRSVESCGSRCPLLRTSPTPSTAVQVVRWSLCVLCVVNGVFLCAQLIRRNVNLFRLRYCRTYRQQRVVIAPRGLISYQSIQQQYRRGIFVL